MIFDLINIIPKRLPLSKEKYSLFNALCTRVIYKQSHHFPSFSFDVIKTILYHEFRPYSRVGA